MHTLSELPGPPTLPIFGNAYPLGPAAVAMGRGRFFEWISSSLDKHGTPGPSGGKLVRLRLPIEKGRPSEDVLVIGDAAAAMAFFREELPPSTSPAPERMEVGPWEYFSERRRNGCPVSQASADPYPPSLFLEGAHDREQHGKNWWMNRKAVNDLIARPKSVTGYIHAVLATTDALAAAIGAEAAAKGARRTHGIAPLEPFTHEIEPPGGAARAATPHADANNNNKGDYANPMADDVAPDIDLEEVLHRFTLDVVASVAYGRPLGLLRPDPPPRAVAFIDAVGRFFATTYRLMFPGDGIPWQLRALFVPIAGEQALGKVWPEFLDARYKIRRISHELWDEKMAELEERGFFRLDLDARARAADEEGCFATHLLAHPRFTSEDDRNDGPYGGGKLAAREVVEEFIAAGVDTTAHWLHWTFGCLAENADGAQARCREEARALLLDPTTGRRKPPATITAEDVERCLPYTRACLREANRLYPIAPFLSRAAPKDMELAGVSLPKGTTVMFSNHYLGRSAAYYGDAGEFRPERWLSKDRKDRPEPGAGLPFGFGSRMCAGRRIAELEAQLAVASVVLANDMRHEAPLPPPTDAKLVLSPSQPIRVRVRPPAA